MIPLDLMPPQWTSELRQEILIQGIHEVNQLIEFGDPTECDCCMGPLRLRHCDACHNYGGRSH